MASLSAARVAPRLALAVLSGLVTAQAFPPHHAWWAAVVGVALLAAAVRGCGWRLAAVLGLAHGLAFFLPTLSWSGVYVGDLPWVALAALEALYIAAMTAVVAVVQRPMLRRRIRPLAHAVLPLAWVVQEWARDTTPFGGFPWARLAFSQADGPLLVLARFTGAPGVTFAVAALGAALHATVVAVSQLVGRPRPRGLVAPARSVGVVLVVLALAPLAVALTMRAPTDGQPVSILLVQGNVPQAGLDFNAQRRAVLDNHVRATLAASSQERTPPSLVVWPENSSDIDPFTNPDAKAEIALAVRAARAPLMVGAVLDGPGRFVSNASLFYRPDGQPPQRYLKRHPVPFGEYIPYRDFFRRFSDKVDLVRRDFAQGSGPAAFEVPVAGGRTYWAIPSICFEVAYDDLMRDSTLQPGRQASVLVVQTNNATFGYTAESEQQFAISRLRAVEHGRSVVHVSTVGVSGFINPDGTFTDKTTLFTQAARRGTPVVRSEVTPSDRIGALPEYAATGALTVLLGLSLWWRRRPARVSTSPLATRKESVGV